MSTSPYPSLSSLIAEINRLATAGEWEAAARITQQLQLMKLPAATPGDREAIEAALKNIAEITERAEPLQGDLARLLKAFG